MTHSLLILSERKSDAQFARALSEAARFRLLENSLPGSLESLSREGPLPLVFVDANAVLPEFHEALKRMPPEIAARLRENTCVLADNALELCTGTLLDARDPVAHYLCRNSWSEEGAHAAGFACAEILRVAFGLADSGGESRSMLERMLPGETEFQTLAFQESMQKGFGAEAIGHYLKELNLNDRISSTIANCADELITNAIFDAPMDETGSQKLSRTARSKNFALMGKHSVELRMGVNKRFIAMTVIDHMGTINRASIHRHVARSHAGMPQATEKAGSGSIENAGMGLASIFRSGGSLLFACEPGVRTEATAVFKRARTIRESKELFQLLSTRFYRSQVSLC